MIAEEDNDRHATIYVTKEMDWLPPRSKFPGSRCFSLCCKPPSLDDEEDNSLALSASSSCQSEDDVLIGASLSTSKQELEPEEDVPTLSFSDDEEGDEAAPKTTGDHRQLTSTAKSIRDASSLLLKFCQLLFAFVVMERTFGKKKKGGKGC